MRKRFRITLALLLFAFCLYLFALSAHAQTYVEIKADIETIRYRSTDTNDAASASHRSFSLICTMGTNEWRIENNLMIGGDVKWFYDGTNLYDSLQVTKPLPDDIKDKLSQHGFAIAPFQSARSNLTINIATTTGGYPLGNLGVNVPWLAFCSGNYLKRQGRIVPLPVGDLRHEPDGFAYSDKTETFEDELGLPRTMDLFTSESLFEASVKRNDFLGLHDVDLWKKGAEGFQFPAIDGVLKFHYSVSESTNFMGWHFPAKFEWYQNEYGTNGEWFTAHRGSGRITSIRAAARPGNLFDPSMRQTIIDFRFRDDANGVRSLTYTSTNAFAAKTNDQLLQEKFGKWINSTPASPTTPFSRTRVLFVVIILFAAATSLAYFFIRKNKPSR
ncbi:MAG: hypothetical protein JWR26_4902 [Pedosphaera sp.]|nr:hypothetical protein [Pedosphaera sp.]